MIKTIAIIANGEEAHTPYARAALAQCDGCVCCDRLPPPGAPPLLQIVGDMDSCRDAIPAEFLTDLHEDQDTNDLTKAMRWTQQHYPKAIWHFFAVTGKREDHTLANLALIAAMAKPATIHTPSGTFQLILPNELKLQTVRVQTHAPISFLSFTRQTITASGVQWPVCNLMLEHLWQATLNRTLDQGEITLEFQAPLYIYQPHLG